MQLILVRHALPIRQESATDAVDPVLAPLGRRQAEAVAQWLAGESVDAIVSSPMRRAQETAAPLARVTGLPVVTDLALEEYDGGRRSYIPLHEVTDPDHPRRRRVRAGLLPDFVDVSGFRKRVADGLGRVTDAHPGRSTVVCFCHGGVINAYVSTVLGIERPLPFPIDYVSITRILVSRDGRRVVRSINEDGHARALPRPEAVVVGG